MQTFLPYPDFNETARCLDYRRLGKQRVEACQILYGMDRSHFSWKNHPACRMWKGYNIALAIYGIAICTEWINRGYTDNLLSKFYDALPDYTFTDYDKPFWLGNEDFHNSHKSNLLRKNYRYYHKYNWDVPDNLPYYWPVEPLVQRKVKYVRRMVL